MSQQTPPFELQQEGQSAILKLLPELNNVQWGDIDAIGTQVLNSISTVNHPHVIVDLSPLNYMGSAMVALIVRVWKATQAKQGKIAVVCPHEGVKEVLKLASLDKVWAITENQDQARSILGIRGGSSSSSSSSGGSGINAGWIVAGILLIACIGMGIVTFFPDLLGKKGNNEAPAPADTSSAESPTKPVEAKPDEMTSPPTLETPPTESGTSETLPPPANSGPTTSDDPNPFGGN